MALANQLVRIVLRSSSPSDVPVSNPSCWKQLVSMWKSLQYGAEYKFDLLIQETYHLIDDWINGDPESVVPMFPFLVSPGIYFMITTEYLQESANWINKYIKLSSDVGWNNCWLHKVMHKKWKHRRKWINLSMWRSWNYGALSVLTSYFPCPTYSIEELRSVLIVLFFFRFFLR